MGGFNTFARMGQLHMAIYAAIETDMKLLEDDASLLDEINFEKRVDAIDFIEFQIIDRLSSLETSAPAAELVIRAELLKGMLLNVDTTLFSTLRENIKNRVYSGGAFREMVRHYVQSCFETSVQQGRGYTNLDIFVSALLHEYPAPEPIMEPKPGMVFYQKTPAKVIFELAAALGGDDVLADIGSGLGQLALLVNLLSGAATIGVEYEPTYCKYATSCADQLGLPNVTFINGDALDADYSRVTAVFMYTPFMGQMLQQMLDKLYKRMHERAMRIFSYGPCTPVVEAQPWLLCVNNHATSADTLCEFRSNFPSE